MINDDDREAMRVAPAGSNPKDVARALAVEVGALRELNRLILADLSPDTFGVSWWTGLSVPHRVLASDYLLRAVQSVERNLVDAHLHLSMYRSAIVAERARFERAAAETPRGEPPRMPEVAAPLDLLGDLEAQLHAAGFFRAIGSALDVLGIVICGVVGVPADLRRADLTTAERKLPALIGAADGDWKDHLRSLAGSLRTGKCPSGTLHWHEYVLAQRNMLVHRPRRFEHIEGGVIPTGLVDAVGRPSVRARVHFRLPRSPDLSDIESMLTHGPVAVLSEEADTTMSGVRVAMLELARDVGERLLAIWHYRRGASDPGLQMQPQNMWKAPSQPGEFLGFTTSDEPKKPAAVRVGGDAILRLKAAGLADADREKVWASYDVTRATDGK